MGGRRDFSDRALGGLDAQINDGQERRRGLVGALDSGLAISLPVSCLLMGVALGWTFAYVREWPFLAGALCFAAAGVVGRVGLVRAPGPLTVALHVLTLLLAAVAVVLLVLGVR